MVMGSHRCFLGQRSVRPLYIYSIFKNEDIYWLYGEYRTCLLIICVLTCRLDFMAPILVITGVYFSHFSLQLDLVNNVCDGGHGASKMGLKWGVITDNPVEKNLV